MLDLHSLVAGYQLYKLEKALGYSAFEIGYSVPGHDQGIDLGG